MSEPVRDVSTPRSPASAAATLLLVVGLCGCVAKSRAQAYGVETAPPAPPVVPGAMAASDGAVVFGGSDSAAMPPPRPRPGRFETAQAPAQHTARPPAQKRSGSVVVLPLVPKRTDAATVEILTDILVNAVATVSGYGVIAPADLDAMLGAERMKEALGCDSVSCYADIGGALNAQFLVSGSVSRLGSRIIVTLSMVDTKAQKVLSRGRAETENNEDLYMAAIEQAVSELIAQAPN